MRKENSFRKGLLSLMLALFMLASILIVPANVSEAAGESVTYERITVQKLFLFRPGNAV